MDKVPNMNQISDKHFVRKSDEGFGLAQSLNQISGPISMHVLDWNGKIVYLLADMHNSLSGNCGSHCDEFLELDSNVKTKRYGKGCSTLPVFLDDLFQNNNMKGVKTDFYFETPFVYSDSVPRKKAYTDNIDIIQIVMSNALKRSKKDSQYMPNIHLHYCDIRDVYHGESLPNNCNPFSGTRLSVLINNVMDKYILDLTCKKQDNVLIKNDKEELLKIYHDVSGVIDYILNNAWEIFDMMVNPCSDLVGRINKFCSPLSSVAGKNLLERMKNIVLVASEYDGRFVHRSCKQLMKIRRELADLVREFIVSEFNNELISGKRIIEDWKMKMNNLLLEDVNLSNVDRYMDRYEEIGSLPNMAMITLSSTIMDVYVLGRMLYNKDSKMIITFTGAAHTERYLRFFQDVIGIIPHTSISASDDAPRCIITE